MTFAVFCVVHITYISHKFPFTVMNNVGLFFLFSDIINLFCRLLAVLESHILTVYSVYLGGLCHFNPVCQNIW